MKPPRCLYVAKWKAASTPYRRVGAEPNAHLTPIPAPAFYSTGIVKLEPLALSSDSLALSQQGFAISWPVYTAGFSTNFARLSGPKYKKLRHFKFCQIKAPGKAPMSDIARSTNLISKDIRVNFTQSNGGLVRGA
ncbi:uncharacterized protein VTP21DRAFT_1525 [Calcarisporiella thermophila]|uniref:uncharacterized protein n=1 Tax=Calcarisporiella thermophila TaxID=911321 RepID=UPI0037441EAD